jgi:hypothetical protein
MLPGFDIQCPYCGETIEILVDDSAGEEQRYVEDCQVCCRPISISVSMDGDGGWRIGAAGENES